MTGYCVQSTLTKAANPWRIPVGWTSSFTLTGKLKKFEVLAGSVMRSGGLCSNLLEYRVIIAAQAKILL